MKFTTTSGGIPVGTYAVEFVSATDFEGNSSNEYGPAVLLTWQVTNGDLEGETATRIVSAKLSPKSNLYRFVTALKGSKPEVGEQIDLDTFVGTTGMVVVEETGNGGTRVETFIRT